MRINNLINLDSYIRINSIREDFEKDCLYVSSMDEVKNIDIYKCKNVIFETSQLRNLFYEQLQLRDTDHTVINCLASEDIFDSLLNTIKGIAIFDNVCSCKNNDILDKVMNYKGKKLLVC